MNENDLNSLNNEQQNILLLFSEITEIKDFNLCLSILISNNWNLQYSIDNFMNNRNNNNNNNNQNNNNNNNTNNNSSSLSINNSNNQNITRNLLIEEHLNINNITQRHENEHNNIYDFLITPLRWLFRIYPESLNPDEDSIKFSNEFKTLYGEDSPQFRGVSYNQAVASANRETKFLLIYLHSPLHEDTTRFCR